MKTKHVTLLAHSTSWVGIPVMSVLVKWPTVKLAELRTHRLISQTDLGVIESAGNDSGLSCNFFSSRAVPIDLQVDQVIEDPFVPIWTMANKGMSGPKVDDDSKIEYYNKVWAEFADDAISNVRHLQYIGLHKQDLALFINPMSYTLGVLTGDATAWEHFFKLRCGDNVYPAVRQIAEEIREVYMNSTPTILEPEQWHTVFDSDVWISMSKCAMISYNNHEKVETTESHLKRASRLVADGHVSTAEHQLQVPTEKELYSADFVEMFVKGGNKLFRGKYVSNIKGWKRLRELVENNILKPPTNGI